MRRFKEGKRTTLRLVHPPVKLKNDKKESVSGLVLRVMPQDFLQQTPSSLNSKMRLGK